MNVSKQPFHIYNFKQGMQCAVLYGDTIKNAFEDTNSLCEWESNHREEKEHTRKIKQHLDYGPLLACHNHPVCLSISWTYAI